MTPSDLDYVLALEHREEHKAFIGQWPGEEHERSMARADREHLIITRADDHASLGYCICYDVAARGFGIYIKRIALDVKSTGAGRLALAELAARAFDERRVDMVTLAVRKDNLRAQRAYRAAGFVELIQSPAERREMLNTVDRFFDDCLVMVLRRPA